MDPKGRLCEDVLVRIPKTRLKEVVWIADDEPMPVGFDVARRHEA